MRRTTPDDQTGGQSDEPLPVVADETALPARRDTTSESASEHLFVDPRPTERGQTRHIYEPTDTGGKLVCPCGETDPQTPDALAYEQVETFTASADACSACLSEVGLTTAAPQLASGILELVGDTVNLAALDSDSDVLAVALIAAGRRGLATRALNNALQPGDIPEGALPAEDTDSDAPETLSLPE